MVARGRMLALGIDSRLSTAPTRTGMRRGALPSYRYFQSQRETEKVQLEFARLLEGNTRKAGTIESKPIAPAGSLVFPELLAADT